MIQVSSAWGFLASDVGPAVRQPANCAYGRHGDQVRRQLRFPEFDDAEKHVLTMLKNGASSINEERVRARVEHATEKLYAIWKPIGAVEPLPSAVWRVPAPNMFWLPDMMLPLPGRRM